MEKKEIQDSITIQPVGGLCNYLRVVFSYNLYAKSINKNLIVVWKDYKASGCNGFFLDYFEEVDNIKFVSNSENKLFYKGNRACPKFKPDYSKLKLKKNMLEIINNKIKKLDNNYISVHIRRTDALSSDIKNNRVTSYSEFFKFIEKNIGNQNLYIATDNSSTYNEFAGKYKDKVKFSYHKEYARGVRKTSLKDAIIDLYLCIKSNNFMGTYYSTFSDLIKIIRLKNNLPSIIKNP